MQGKKKGSNTLFLFFCGNKSMEESKDPLSDRETFASIGNGVEVHMSQIEDAGVGLFATRDFPQGTPITLYEGQRISYHKAQEEEAKDPCNVLHMRSLFPLHTVIDGSRNEDGSKIIDPNSERVGKGGAAFANDALDSSFSNNAEFDVHDWGENKEDPYNRNPDERHVFIRAHVFIRTSEEIFVNYGPGHWEIVHKCKELQTCPL